MKSTNGFNIKLGVEKKREEEKKEREGMRRERKQRVEVSLD